MSGHFVSGEEKDTKNSRIFKDSKRILLNLVNFWTYDRGFETLLGASNTTIDTIMIVFSFYLLENIEYWVTWKKK